MKILVLGGKGMAGHVISLYFIERGYDVSVYSTSPVAFGSNNLLGNAFESDKFTEMLLTGNFDIVINCIGLLNQYAENSPKDAVYLNSYLPHLIAETLKGSGGRLFHMSTDCVFSGNTGPYFENSFRDGATFYDRTKALGEVVDSRNLTFRNSIIGPDLNTEGIGLFNWFMKQEGAIQGFTGAIWTGVTTLTLAKAMERAITENLTGLYNLVNNQSINKYDLLQLFNRHFKDGSLRISKNSSLQLDKSLRNSRTDFSFEVPSYEQMIIEMKDWILSHKDLYSAYFR